MTIEIFQFPVNGMQLRAVDRDGEPWFVAGDIATALELGNLHSSLARLDDDEKGLHSMDTPGGQQVSIVSEAGLYSLILRSRKAMAKLFKRWVTHDVLPAIRRNGGYRLPTQGAIPTQSEALRGWADEVDRNAALAAKVTELEPIAAQAEFHRSADGLVPVGDFANKLKAWAKENHGVKVLHQEVWDFLADIRIVIRGDKIRNNQPTAFATDRGFVKVKETEYVDSEGFAHISVSTRLTPAGEGWAWDRAVRRIAEHGSLRPTTSIERKAS